MEEISYYDILKYMEPILVLKDEDIYPDANIPVDQKYENPRDAVKAVVFDSDGCIALVGHTHKLLPGGGVEKDETFEDAIKRECVEEIGCEVRIEKEFALTKEYRAKIGRVQNTHFFLAYVEGRKGIPATIQEDEIGIETHWVLFDAAIKMIEDEIPKISSLSYYTNFNARTHLRALKELEKIINQVK